MNLDSITQRYLSLFPGDFTDNPSQRQTPKVLFATTKTAEYSSPKKLCFNQELAKEIGLGDFQESETPFLVGSNLPRRLKSYSTAYAGHQFGNWAGQLGDGRAIFAGEIKSISGKNYEIQWKGAGATPYSRFADGKAVLRSSLREYLMSEAMHFLGVPTTRALSLALSGEEVIRDVLYIGNPAPEKGAVVIRVAESFLRFGHFEWLAAQNELEILQQLADFVIMEYYPEIDKSSKEKYHNLFSNIVNRTINMLVDWYRVGFVHGVMNTDNMSVLGLTIDYGPFSMLDEFDLNFTPNTTDLPGRRYAFGKQAQAAQWNLWQLANALFPIIKNQEFLEEELNRFNTQFWDQHDQMMASKMGLEKLLDNDKDLIILLQKLLQELQMDFTLFFIYLEKYPNVSVEGFMENVSYLYNIPENKLKLQDFLNLYENRLQQNCISREESIAIMQKNNPKFVLRNYLLYQCIEELNQNKFSLLEQLIQALKNPYQEIFSAFSVKQPAEFHNVLGSNMLSCSS